MRYAKIENGQVTAYPYTHAMLREDNPQVSFPRNIGAWLADYNVFPVLETNSPQPSSINVNVVESVPEYTDGAWRQAWEEVPASAEEVLQRQREQADEAVRLSAMADSFVQSFIAMTPQQVVDHVETNVTNILSTKTLLKKMAVMMLLMARREFRE